ncbi:hypothetical protein M8818_002750 [Zalaria obscura]|uniref:Uncharacterized protein n=1 Tax=Zalaria obscura TaxID=2024903 RepID=A0ACC3SIP6_9PEZI
MDVDRPELRRAAGNFRGREPQPLHFLSPTPRRDWKWPVSNGWDTTPETRTLSRHCHTPPKCNSDNMCAARLGGMEAAFHDIKGPASQLQVAEHASSVPACRFRNFTTGKDQQSSKPNVQDEQQIFPLPKASFRAVFLADWLLTKPQRRPSDTPKAPLTQRLDATRERTKQLSAQVKSSLSALTPHENIYNIPNILTASRLIAAPVVGYLVLHEQHKWALILFAYAGVTDLIDGWMARRFNLQTVVGSVIDPMADKVLMTVLTVTLAVKGLLPVYLATLILGRDVALAIAAIYYRYASLPAPKTFSRYWDFSLPSAEVHPTTMSKLNTFLQLLLIGATLAMPVVTAHNHHLGPMADLGLEGVDLGNVMTAFQWVVAGTTVWSGLSYAYLKNVVKILGKDEALKVKQGRRGRAIIGVIYGSVVLMAAYLAVTKDKEREARKAEEEV